MIIGKSLLFACLEFQLRSYDTYRQHVYVCTVNINEILKLDWAGKLNTHISEYLEKTTDIKWYKIQYTRRIKDRF
mgnify:FL=1